ncbi:hypothetical protein POSPLADRAFT_1182434 [Postia placenta MAD-698-R-SB12]|uniref:DUF6533 domain-containing protein n=1 Tax=Postia placenta MAD-698-R-SB12 TaxID=670580 RepID=A0A1X6MYG1_9APHY|nr:hypothetical protein POSPLADRAFT_1182434 [Postia placenta MAD-698-R-SB12]OSX61290.1 hypothetical protein POSPLADRAFT_1182434 [Postia placenta MAD-698-R-SB12]
MLLSNFCSVAATTLIFYDYFLTFSREVRCIWGRKFSGATVIFMLNRYLTLVYRVLMLVDMLPWQSQPQTVANDVCIGVLHTTQALTLVSQLIITAFTSLRTYAIWNKDWRIFGLVFFLGIVPCVVNIYYYTLLDIVSAPPPFLGCGEYVNLSPSAATIVSDSIVLILTWLKTAEIQRSFTGANRKGNLVALIQRDGTILILNVLNLVAIKFQAFGSLPAITEVLTSILISRFILNLRGIFLSPGGSNATTSTLRMSQMSSLHFASSIAGNLGAPLGDLVDAEDRIDDSSTARGEVAYVSDDPLAAGLHPEEDEESLVPTERNLKDLYDSEV